MFNTDQKRTHDHGSESRRERNMGQNQGWFGRNGCRPEGMGDALRGRFGRGPWASSRQGEQGPGWMRGGRGMGEHGFGGEHGRGHGRGMRMFGAGDLRYVILGLIAEQPRHGYELIKEIEERLGGTYAPSPGVVYPMLTMLEEMGQASVTTEGTRKLYAITDEGRKALAEQKDLVEKLFARMEAMRERQGAARTPGIERAVQNLRLALRMKGGPLTTEQAHAITDILDDAAKKIERL